MKKPTKEQIAFWKELAKCDLWSGMRGYARVVNMKLKKEHVPNKPGLVVTHEGVLIWQVWINGSIRAQFKFDGYTP